MAFNGCCTMFWFLIFIWIVQVGSVPIQYLINTITVPVKGYSTSKGLPRIEPPETVQEYADIEQAVVEGDLLLPDDRLAVDSLWPATDGVTSIPYKLNKSLDKRKGTILAAFKMITDQTCIRFHEYTNEENYINIIPGKGCASYVGFQGGAQPVFFDKSCTTGNLCHEIMHALGLHHEHTRPDRDRYITIQWDEVVPDKKDNFNIKKGNTQNLDYDPESIMHYGTSYFSVNGKPTIIPKDDDIHMGQRIYLSPWI
ncbi:hypothetical protein DPEC_G00323220 [Dallia pectoralis]|uniref:Uncharacterized protein n=1 Tax=Dallia pectoralis TaxID=75939 RepID=A0ACC2FAN1_DALPE|nr:hypothetical protein DPEC_G00323220 [Dallia pectoralis]